MEDGSFDNNLLTWQTFGEIESWTALEAGPSPIGDASSGVYAFRPVIGGSGSGAQVSIEFNTTTLSNPTINDPGEGYKDGEVVQIDLDGTNVINAQISVPHENQESGWTARPGIDYFVSATQDGEYIGTPQFSYGLRVGNGSGAPDYDFSQEDIQNSALLIKPKGPKGQALVTIQGTRSHNKILSRCTADPIKLRLSAQDLNVNNPTGQQSNQDKSRIDLMVNSGTAEGDNLGQGEIRLYSAETGDNTPAARFKIQGAKVYSAGISVDHTTTDDNRVRCAVAQRVKCNALHPLAGIKTTFAM